MIKLFRSVCHLELGSVLTYRDTCSESLVWASCNSGSTHLHSALSVDSHCHFRPPRCPLWQTCGLLPVCYLLMCHKTREPHEALHAGGRRGLALYAVAAICVRLVTSRRRGDSVKACRQGSPHPELCMALSVLLAIVGCSSAKDSGAKRAYGTHPVIGLICLFRT